MLSDKLIQQLKSENESLQLQLKDLNEMIQVREEELDLLRVAAAEAVEMRSRLAVNTDEIYQMQNMLGIEQQKAVGAAKREQSLEQELLQAIEMETELYNMRDRFASTQAALTDVKKEAESIAGYHSQIAQLKSRVAELESSLEIAMLENGFLKEEVEAYRKEEALRNRSQ